MRTFAIALLMSVSSANAWAAQVAIIIDDMGHHRSNQRFIELASPLTFSFLPYTAFAAEQAQQAASAGYEVMLHLPMASGPHHDAGIDALQLDESQEELVARMNAALARIPQARGVNNHMGSLLTTNVAAMKSVMIELANRELFFIDSRTTAETVAEATARLAGVPTARRHVFLDHERTSEGLIKAWEELLKQAEERGFAIAIAHPHDMTYDFLREHLGELNERGIKLVPVSELTDREQ
ncbi:divergent polysaccharide deacetylase family protein [Pseudidiomarina aestuarii]|uniref:divergent polysaccharide deacetylase family protein n=1 Tax=Pseudidiomarina aestuarii TaxID=624146 RepID=UPI003A988699